MLVWLARHGVSKKRFFEHCLGMVEGQNLVVKEERKTKETPHATREAAVVALDKLVARRESVGWKVDFRGDDAWSDWRGKLALIWARVIDQAQSSGIGIGRRHESSFERLAPNPFDYKPERRALFPEEYTGLIDTGAWMNFVLGHDDLRFDERFEIGPLRSVWGLAAEDNWLWRRISSRKTTDFGKIENGRLVSYVGGGYGSKAEAVHHEDAEAFRQWFPRYLQDDVMSSVLGELQK